MINISGYKVWPREVEDVLYTHPAVKEAAVVGVPDEYRGEAPKAYVALKEGESATEKDLVTHCKEQMAAYKYPRQVSVPGRTSKDRNRQIPAPRAAGCPGQKVTSAGYGIYRDNMCRWHIPASL